MIKSGDIIEFIAIEWNEPHWEFDHPCVVLKPNIRYSPNGDSAYNMIENLAIEIACDGKLEDENVTKEFGWRGWKLSRLNQVARERLSGKDTWKSKIRKVVKQKVKYYLDGEDLEFDIIETIEK